MSVDCAPDIFLLDLIEADHFAFTSILLVRTLGSGRFMQACSLDAEPRPFEAGQHALDPGPRTCCWAVRVLPLREGQEIFAGLTDKGTSTRVAPP